MRFRWISTLLIALGVSAAAPCASALTLPIVGGPGLVQWTICGSSNPCPGSPLWSFTGSAAVVGSFTYDPDASTIGFVLTLATDVTLGVPALLTGTTIAASAIPVIADPLGGGAFVISQSGDAAGVFDPLLALPVGLVLSQNSPTISELICTVGIAADRCAVSVGPGGIEIPVMAGVYFTSFLAFDVNVVPEPSTALLLVGGVIGVALAARRRV